jgi:hypothetical protein
MNTEVADLVSILEDEIKVGEELYRNLEAQRKAIVAWDIANLLDQITARETWLRSLIRLEEKRTEILKALNSSNAQITLRQIIDSLPEGGSERLLFAQLRERARKIFVRLHAEERNLLDLMRNLWLHIQEALGSPTQSLGSVYSKSGATLTTGTRSTLLRGKA